LKAQFEKIIGKRETDEEWNETIADKTKKSEQS
jgi:hypothetical protein